LVIGGAGLGIIIFSKLISWALEYHSQQAMFLFMGLIAGSLPSLLKVARQKTIKPWYLIPFALSLSLMIFMAISDSGNDASPLLKERDLGTLLLLFASGIAGAASMVIPGISGSFVMLLFGTYGTIIEAVKSFDFLILAVVGLGVVIGIIGTSVLIKKLLEKAFGPTYAAILGLVIGSLPVLWPGFSFDLGGIISILFGVLGLATAYIAGGLPQAEQAV
jgi:putative membrane protein